MFSRDKPAPAGKPLKTGAPGLSFIGPEVVISGDLSTAAQIHVEGRIDGNVQCAQLCQGASGAIAGNIVADDARIAGLVEGTVSAQNLTLEASARIKGDIVYQTISIAAGAQVDGRLARRESLANASDPPLLVAAPIAQAQRTSAEPKEDKVLFPLPPSKQAAAG
jgi:cytoskeletal protein CcmA (bactofilin family)